MYVSNRLKIHHTKKGQSVKGRGSWTVLICREFGHEEERDGAHGPNATGFDVGRQQMPALLLNKNHGAVLRSIRAESTFSQVRTAWQARKPL